jgi:hypothetical protein
VSLLPLQQTANLSECRPRFQATTCPAGSEFRDTSYLTILNPYPPNASMGLAGDLQKLALWLAAVTEKSSVLMAVFHKPSVRLISLFWLLELLRALSGCGNLRLRLALFTASFSLLVSSFSNLTGATQTLGVFWVNTFGVDLRGF